MPLIPVFMALIGWRAQAASEKQLAATGGLNGFLLDRLRGLATIRASMPSMRRPASFARMPMS
jgi:ATP-binding cassette subfamily C protein CydD